MSENEELARMWKEAIVAYFKTVSHNFPRNTEEDHENLCQEIQLRCRHSNPGPPKYEAGVLTIHKKSSFLPIFLHISFLTFSFLSAFISFFSSAVLPLLLSSFPCLFPLYFRSLSPLSSLLPLLVRLSDPHYRSCPLSCLWSLVRINQLHLCEEVATTLLLNLMLFSSSCRLRAYDCYNITNSRKPTILGINCPPVSFVLSPVRIPLALAAFCVCLPGHQCSERVESEPWNSVWIIEWSLPYIQVYLWFI
jgi:hypothetical protein